MYNIAKTSKGEILVFFNEIFDALAKVQRPHREAGDGEGTDEISSQQIPNSL